MQTEHKESGACLIFFAEVPLILAKLPTRKARRVLILVKIGGYVSKCMQARRLRTQLLLQARCLRTQLLLQAGRLRTQLGATPMNV